MDDGDADLLDALNAAKLEQDECEQRGQHGSSVYDRYGSNGETDAAKYTHSALSVDRQREILREHAGLSWAGKLDAADALLRPFAGGKSNKKIISPKDEEEHGSSSSDDGGEIEELDAGPPKDLALSVAFAFSALLRFHIADPSEANEREAQSRVELALDAARDAWNVWGGLAEVGSSAADGSGGGGFLSALTATLVGGSSASGAASGTPAANTRERLERELPSDEVARAALEAAGALAYMPFVQASLAFRSGNKLDIARGAYHLRKSWKAFEVAENLAVRFESDGRAVDANSRSLIRLGVGAFHFFVSLIPSSFLWIVELIGFRGDRELALSELEKVRREPQCTRHVEATLLLAVIKHFFQGQSAEARAMVAEVAEEQPNSALLPPVSAVFCRAHGEIDAAIQHYSDSIERAEGQLPQLHCMMAYHRGTCYYMCHRWEECEADLRFFLETTTGRQFRPFAGFMLGFALWKLDRRSEVAPLYRRIAEWVRPNQSYDAFASRKTTIFLEHNEFSKFDELFLGCYGLHHGFQYDRALREMQAMVPVLKEMGTSAENRDCHAQFYWLKGSCLKGLALNPDGDIRSPDDVARARMFLKKATQQRDYVVDETFVVPYAWFELGELEAAEGHYDKAFEIWGFVQKTFSGYDWERILQTRIKSVSDRTKRKMEVR
jgi:tetratricopeptide (TPR) repeat protein